MLSILLTIVGIAGLIFIHELGHFIFAKATGMRVLTFSIGFGPALWKFKRGDTTYKIAAVPLGGYVMVDGGEPEEEFDTQDTSSDPDDPARYENRPWWSKLSYIFAGPAMNWILAVFIAMGALIVGLPSPAMDKALIGGLEEKLPAAQAGFKVNDQITAINDTTVASWQEMVKALDKTAGQQTTIDYIRDGSSATVTLIPEGSNGGQGRLGVWPAQTYSPGMSFGSALLAAPVFTVNQSKIMLSRLWATVTGKGSGRLMGIPGIAKTVYRQAEQGLSDYLIILFSLSLSLAFLNLLPIPALDGGRLLLLLVGLLLKGKMTTKLEGVIHFVGFVLVFGLIIVVSVRDVIDIFR